MRVSKISDRSQLLSHFNLTSTSLVVALSCVLCVQPLSAEENTPVSSESVITEEPIQPINPTPTPTPTPPTPPEDPEEPVRECPPHNPPKCRKRVAVCLENKYVDLDSTNLQDNRVFTDRDSQETDQYGNKGWYGRTDRYRRREGFRKGRDGFLDWLGNSAYTTKFKNYCYLCACTRHWDGCFPPGTEISMADGTVKLVENVSVGDKLLNPVLGSPVEVTKILEGPEAKPLIEYGYGKVLGKVTGDHPVYTSEGLKKASELTLSDTIMDKEGKFHALDSLKLLPVARGQMVINVQVGSEAVTDEKARLLVADGIVVGDLELQNKLIDEGASSK